MEPLRQPYLLFLGDCTDAMEAKTAHGLSYWRRELCLGQYRLPSCTIDLDLPDLDLVQARERGAQSLVVGIANHGGLLNPAWFPSLLAGAELGLDIVSGLHDRLSEVPGLAAVAERSGVALRDIRHQRRPLRIGSGEYRPGKRLLTVGTDCMVGKKFTALSLEREMRARGYRADFRATGQTGIMIAGDGIALDAVPGDFQAGVVEDLCPANDPDHWDVIEGQGSLLSPITSTPLGLLNGAQADVLVLCHNPARWHYHGLPDHPLASIQEVIDMNLYFARRRRPGARFLGVSVNTSELGYQAGRRACEALQEELGMPAVDPLVDGVGPLLDALAQLPVGSDN